MLRVISYGPTRTEHRTLGLKSAQPRTFVVVLFEHHPPTTSAQPIPPKQTKKMSPSDELAYLKSLVGQLTDKIAELEAKATSKKPTPAQQLRTILVGPPGAGTSPSFAFGRSGSADDATGRQGNPGAANTRRVLCMSPRDG